MRFFAKVQIFDLVFIRTKRFIGAGIFDGEMTPFYGRITSYPTFSKKHTSADAIFVRIGKIDHFHDRNRVQKLHIDSDIFDGNMTSYFLDDVISDV